MTIKRFVFYFIVYGGEINGEKVGFFSSNPYFASKKYFFIKKTVINVYKILYYSILDNRVTYICYVYI